MTLDNIQAEIQKREANKEELFNSILREGMQLFESIKDFQTPDTAPSLPKGVTGRRLGDKINIFKEKVTEFSKVKDSSQKHIVAFEKEYNILMQHIKSPSIEHNFPDTSENDLTITNHLKNIKTEFHMLKNLQSHLKVQYISQCKHQFAQQYKLETNTLKKSEIQRNRDTYKVLGEFMSYEGILRLKNLNTNLDKPMSVGAIGTEYKSLSKDLSSAQEGLKSIKAAQIKLKASLLAVSDYEKSEKKAAAYLKEKEKHADRLDSIDEDSRNEVEGFVKSYDDLYNESNAKLAKIQDSLVKKYGIRNVEDYQAKYEINQSEFAKFETKTNRLEKRVKLLHDILSDIHACRQTLMKSKKLGSNTGTSGTNKNGTGKKIIKGKPTKSTKSNSKLSRSSRPRKNS